jgi:hypothetical protein
VYSEAVGNQTFFRHPKTIWEAVDARIATIHEHIGWATPCRSQPEHPFVSAVPLQLDDDGDVHLPELVGQRNPL